jgi:hypothetical protein
MVNWGRFTKIKEVKGYERDPRHSRKDKATGFGWSKMKPNQWVWPQVSEEDWCAELFLKRPLRGRPKMAAHSLLMSTATLSSRWSSRVIRSRLLELFNLDRIIFTAWMILNLHVVVNNYCIFEFFEEIGSFCLLPNFLFSNVEHNLHATCWETKWYN